jgi:hypothetical protein
MKCSTPSRIDGILSEWQLRRGSSMNGAADWSVNPMILD